MLSISGSNNNTPRSARSDTGEGRPQSGGSSAGSLTSRDRENDRRGRCLSCGEKLLTAENSIKVPGAVRIKITDPNIAFCSGCHLVYHIEKASSFGDEIERTSQVQTSTSSSFFTAGASVFEKIRSVESVRGVFTCAEGDRKWDHGDVLVPKTSQQRTAVAATVTSTSSFIPKLQLLGSKSMSVLDEIQVGDSNRNVEDERISADEYDSRDGDSSRLASTGSTESTTGAAPNYKGGNINSNSKSSKLSRRLKSARDELFFVDDV